MDAEPEKAGKFGANAGRTTPRNDVTNGLRNFVDRFLLGQMRIAS